MYGIGFKDHGCIARSGVRLSYVYAVEALPTSNLLNTFTAVLLWGSEFSYCNLQCLSPKEHHSFFCDWDNVFKTPSATASLCAFAFTFNASHRVL